MKSAPSQPSWVEMRTVAGPSSVVQCVFSGGPFTTASQVTPNVRPGHNGPPPPCPGQATWPTRTWFGPRTWQAPATDGGGSDRGRGELVGRCCVHFLAHSGVVSLAVPVGARADCHQMRSGF
jgi:hypothetical protein